MISRHRGVLSTGGDDSSVGARLQEVVHHPGELDEVVEALEAGDASLEESLERFERGVQLAKKSHRALDAMEQRVERLIADRDGVEVEEMDADERKAALAAAQAKLLACDVAVEVAQQGQILHGGWGYAEEYPISRYVADSNVLPIFEGVKPILELKVIARTLLAS